MGGCAHTHLQRCLGTGGICVDKTRTVAAAAVLLDIMQGCRLPGAQSCDGLVWPPPLHTSHKPTNISRGKTQLTLRSVQRLSPRFEEDE